MEVSCTPHRIDEGTCHIVERLRPSCRVGYYRIIAHENSSPHWTAHPEAEPGELLDDPIVKRAVERDMRRLLRQQGEDDAAAELMREQFGSADDTHDASTGGGDDDCE